MTSLTPHDPIDDEEVGDNTLIDDEELEDD